MLAGIGDYCIVDYLLQFLFLEIFANILLNPKDKLHSLEIM